MFDELVGSRAKRQGGPVRGMAVGMLHGLMIAGVVRVTGRPPETPPAVPVVIPILYQSRPAPVPSSPVAVPPSAPADAPILPAAPIDVPLSIPPIVPWPPIDAATMQRILSSGIPGAGPAVGDPGVPRGVLEAAMVDEPAVIVHQPSPRYPPALQQAGREGRVLVEFIIDTTGHMEGASLRVLESSHAGFEAAAGETIRRSVFRPARVRGNPVRQRTVQSITFRILPE